MSIAWHEIKARQVEVGQRWRAVGGGGEVNFLSGYARLAAKVYLRVKQVYSNSKQQ